MKTVKYIIPNGFAAFAHAANSLNCWSEQCDIEKILPDFYIHSMKEKSNNPTTYKSIMEKTPDDIARVEFEWRRRVIKRILADKPKAFRTYLLKELTIEKLRLNQVLNLTIDYEQFRSKVLVVRSLLILRGKIAALGSFKRWLVTVPCMRNVSIDEDNKIRYEAGKELLDGLDTDRIQQCSFCSNVYWAERLGTKYCSPRCGAASRQRKSVTFAKSKEGLKDVDLRRN